MKRIISFMITVVMCSYLLSACGETSATEEQAYQMFYVNESETQIVNETYEPKSTDTASCVQEFLDMQSTAIPERKSFRHVLPEGVNIIGVELNEDGILTININAAYQSLERSREILARAGLVRTFGQIPGINFTQIQVEGAPLLDSQEQEVGLMTPEAFVENSGKEINTYQDITMTLYFANEDGTKLEPEQRKVYYSSNVPLERVVVEQLIKGPKESGHYATLPSDTNILSATISDGICYVNFDDKVSQTTVNAAEETAVYSIVNSLAQVCQVDKVQFSIDGESDVAFRKSVQLDQLFSWDASYLNLQ